MFAGEGEIIPNVLAFAFVKKMSEPFSQSLFEKVPSQFINEAEPKKKKNQSFFFFF